MTSKNLINYCDTLDKQTRGRYNEKIRLINGVDPYKIDKADWCRDIDKWAGVTYPDIVNFLLYTSSAYTLDELKSYKGLEAYNQFVCGWVRDVSVCIVNDICVHTARVLHSQRLSDTALTPWLIIQHDGKVLAAHCNCMAGLGEACTHIAALLFSIEATVKIRESRTVTEDKSYWLPASVRGVSCSTIQDIDFTSAKTKKKILDSKLSGAGIPKRGHSNPQKVLPPSEEEISSFLRQLHLTGERSAILSLKTPFSDQFVPQTLNDKFPQILTDLMNNDLLDANFGDIIEFCKSVNITVSPDESASVEKATRKQSNSKLWHRFRSGRITASKIYSVCHSNPVVPSQSLVNSICHPETVNFKSAATSWGCKHEKQARDTYTEAMELLHDNFNICDAGFTIDVDKPIFGASPDGTVSCDCCGSGVVEIKCPYCVRSSSLDEYVEKGRLSCLEETEDGKRLKTNHPYYYQVQMQISVCKKEYSDFVVWTEKEMHIERIEPDNAFWLGVQEKAGNFHAMAIMPELVGKFYSRKNMPPVHSAGSESTCTTSSTDHSNSSDEVFCLCQQPESADRPMVACDNRKCQYQWFHLDCLKISEEKLPKGKWYCPDCSKQTEFQTKKRVRRK